MTALDLDTLIRKYQESGVLIDTNLMMLIVIGSYDINRIATFKRTRAYTIEDFRLMMAIIDRFRHRVTTPHILTEVDNLTRQLPRSEHRKVADIMGRLISNLSEIYVSSDNAAKALTFANVGLTDSATAQIEPHPLIITDDFELSNRLASMGRDVLNINHIRPMAWLWNQ